MNEYRLYEKGDTVRIADIKDAPFPSVIGQCGMVREYLLDNACPTGRLYVVVIRNMPYACTVDEIEPDK